MEFPPISERQHVEIYVLPNREAEEQKPKGLAFLIAIILVFVFIKVSIPPTSNPDTETDSLPNNTTNNFSQTLPPSGGGSSSGYLSPLTPSHREPVASRVRISECDGVRYEGANFRESPSPNPSSIKGIVRADTWVTLTGVRANSDGMTWYEVIHESDDFSSTQPDGTRLIGSDQIGWIEACFVES